MLEQPLSKKSLFRFLFVRPYHRLKVYRGYIETWQSLLCRPSATADLQHYLSERPFLSHTPFRDCRGLLHRLARRLSSTSARLRRRPLEHPVPSDKGLQGSTGPVHHLDRQLCDTSAPLRRRLL